MQALTLLATVEAADVVREDPRDRPKSKAKRRQAGVSAVARMQGPPVDRARRRCEHLAMPLSSMSARLVALVVCMALPGGCAPQMSRLTASEQASFGTRTFAAPATTTFAAARDALPRLGYVLTYVDVASGRIATQRQQAGVRAWIGIDGRGSAVLWLQYDLRIEQIDAGHTRVIATPHMFEGARDISSERTWTVGGDEGLRARWRAMFEAIAAGL